MNYRFLKIFLAIALSLIPASRATTQTGNMSDITGPDPGAIADPTPTETTTDTTPTPSEDANLDPTTEPLAADGAADRPPAADGAADRPPAGDGQGPPAGDGQGPPAGDGQGPPAADGQGPPAGDGQGPPAGDGQGPPAGDGQGPPAGDGQGPPAGDGQRPPAGDGQRPPAPRDRQEPIQVQDFNQPPPQPAPPQPAPPPTQQNQRPNRTEEKPTEKKPTQEIGKVEQRVDRPAYEAQLQQVDVDVAVQLIEEYQAVEFSDYLGVELFGEVPSFEEISATLYDLWQVTGQKAAFVYVSAGSEGLNLFTVVPSASGTASSSPQILASSRSIPGVIVAQNIGPIQSLQLPNVKGKKLRETIKEFRNQITDRRHRRSQKYLANAQQLYQWLIAPMSEQLEAEGIDILVLSMDSGLRSLPIGALHDGEQFLIEKYAVALVPSFGLTDVSYSDVRQSQMLAMGASEFTELNPLPAVSIEMQNILRNPWQGQFFLNQEFTIQKFRQLNQQEKFGIIHLATHGEFEPGNLSDSYIQFYNRKMNLVELREMANELGWSQTENIPIELLVLSACRTAVGSPEAELGFAGLAIQAGVKSALASLWYVSDAGTLGLMSEFYQHLGENPIKSQALRQTQIAMLKGELRIENGQLRLSNGDTLPLTPELAAAGNVDLSHPYFWSAFMMIGNWN